MKLYEYEENGIIVQFTIIEDSYQRINGYPCYRILQQFFHKDSGIKSLWFDAEDFNQTFYKTEGFAELILKEYLRVNDKNFEERSIKNDKCAEFGPRCILRGR